jgi:hypothetical protein
MNIQISILQNTHMGKDTHIRQIKLFGPRKYAPIQPEKCRKSSTSEKSAN